MRRNAQELDAEGTIRKKEVKKLVKRKRKNRVQMNLKNKLNHVEMEKSSEVEVKKTVVVNVEVVTVEVVIVVKVVTVVVVAGEGEVEVVVMPDRMRNQKVDRGKKTRVATIHGKVKSPVMVLTENPQTETPNLRVLRQVSNFKKEKSQEILRPLDRKEKMVERVNQEVKGSLTVVTEAVEEVEEAAEGVEMAVQRPAMVPTRQSKPKIDNSEDLTI